MENKWYGEFTFEEVENIRKDAKDNLATRADIAVTTGNNMELAELIVSGPTPEMISALKDEYDYTPDNAGDLPNPDLTPNQIATDFDNVWGKGASDYYKDYDAPNGFVEHIVDIPRGIAHGVAEAAASFGEGFFTGRGEADVAARTAAQAYAARVAEARGLEAPEQAKIDPYEPKEWDANSILRNTIEDPSTFTGDIVKGISQFAAPFAFGMGGVSKLGVLANAGTKGQILAATIVGGITDFSMFDADDPLIAVAISDYFEIEHDIVDDYLRHGVDDSDAEKRFRRALEGGIIGIGMDVAMVGIARVFRNVRSGKIDPQSASDEIKTILDEIAAEDLQASLNTKAEDNNPRKPSKTRLWMFDAQVNSRVPRVTQPTDAASKVAGDIVTENAPKETIETLSPSFAEVAEATTGKPHKPKVSHKDNEIAIGRATRIWEAARQVGKVDDAWALAKEFMRNEVDNFAEHGIRSVDELQNAVRAPFNTVSKLVDAGDIEGLQSFANESKGIVEIRLNAAAIGVAGRALREQTNRMSELVEASIASRRLSPHEESVIRDMFHKQVQLTMEVEALDQNFRSSAGAFLGQYTERMSVYDEIVGAAKAAADSATTKGLSKRAVAKAAKAAAKETEKAILKNLKKNVGDGNGNYLAKKYRELVKQGVDPLIAYRRVTDLALDAHRSGTHLDPKVRKGISDARKTMEENRLERFFRGLEQWRYNAMLSGLKTHQINFLSSFAQMTSRVVYEAAWAGVTRDKEMMKLTGQKIVGMTSGMKDSLFYAWEATKQMRPILDNLTMIEDFDPVYKNSVLTYPTRLMIGSDQFIKQLAYRGEVRASAIYDADLMNLKGAEREAYLKQRMSQAFDPETGAGLDMLAIVRAQEVTFQKPFDPKSKYLGERLMAKGTDMTSKTLAGRFLFPFMRIFFRLTDEGIRMTPVLREGIGIASKLTNTIKGTSGSSKYFDDLFGHNGKPAQARAFGEYTVGLGFVGWTMGMVAEGNMTGGEERHYVDAMMRRKVMPPYHMKIGDELYDYSRFEPFAFPMKFWANSMIRLRKVDASNDRGEYERESEMMQAQMGAFAYVFGEAMLNNSFVEGLESLVKITSGSFDKNEAWKRPVHTAIDSYVPNIIRKANASLDDTGHKYKANPLTPEAFARHFSAVMNMENVDIERNQFTGEPYVYTDHNDLEGHLLFVGKPELNDKVMELLIEANENTGKQYILKRPGAVIPNTDLREHKGDDQKRSLYDEYQDTFSKAKINGRTYREALEILADDSLFKTLPWGNRTRTVGSKAEAIGEIKNAYEAETLTHLKNNSKSFAYLLGKQAFFERVQDRKENVAKQEHDHLETLGITN